MIHLILVALVVGLTYWVYKRSMCAGYARQCGLSFNRVQSCSWVVVLHRNAVSGRPFAEPVVVGHMDAFDTGCGGALMFSTTIPISADRLEAAVKALQGGGYPVTTGSVGVRRVFNYTCSSKYLDRVTPRGVLGKDLLEIEVIAHRVLSEYSRENVVRFG